MWKLHSVISLLVHIILMKFQLSSVFSWIYWLCSYYSLMQCRLIFFSLGDIFSSLCFPRLSPFLFYYTFPLYVVLLRATCRPGQSFVFLWVFQGDPEGALTAQNRLQSDHDWTESPGSPSQIRYTWDQDKHSKSIKILFSHAYLHLCGVGVPPSKVAFVEYKNICILDMNCILCRQDTSAADGGGGGCVWPGGAGHEEVSCKWGGAASWPWSSAVPLGKR